jgi:hypothetical protein
MVCRCASCPVVQCVCVCVDLQSQHVLYNNTRNEETGQELNTHNLNKVIVNNKQQYTQSTCNVTLRRVHLKQLSPWKSNKYYTFLCVCACARVALLIQHATPRHILICGLPVSTTFFEIVSKTRRSTEESY